MKYAIELPGGKREEGVLNQGEMKLFPLGVGETAPATFEPIAKVDIGAGRGMTLTRDLDGGVVGIILDGRGRPLMTVPDDKTERIEQMVGWLENLNIYNAEELRALGQE